MGCCGDDHPTPRDARELIEQVFSTAGPEAAAKHRLAICLNCGAGGRPCVDLAKSGGSAELRCAHRARMTRLNPALPHPDASCPENRW